MSEDSASPRVSVVMPVFDGERYLEEALDSILGQSLGDFELIVIDDGSTDGTAGILEERARRDERLHLFHEEHRGLIAALNQGCGLARGTYIARMDADDVAMPDRLERQVAFLDRHPAVAVLGGAVRVIGGNGTFSHEWHPPAEDRQIKDMLRRSNLFTHSAVMMRKDAFDAAGGYRKPFLHAEDYDLWLRMADRFELANLAEVIACSRIHPGQVSAANLRLQVASALAAQAAARIRRDTGRDPVLDEEVVNGELLARLAVSSDRVSRELIARQRSWAAQMIAIGEYETAERALGEVLAVSRAEAMRDAMAEIQVEVARCRRLLRRPRAALVALAKAMALRPALVRGFLRHPRRAWRALGTPGSPVFPHVLRRQRPQPLDR